uniref:Phorbol-ester/DAG-type domain-containing protein n=1 Tax=Oryza brachyantha TaxID=4533 RepID=J3L804_ORYBR
MEETIEGHRLHASCTLVLNGNGGAFTCAACKRGSSQAYRYSCDGCRFDFHGQCVTSPDSISFWGHPHHPLKLVRSGPDLAGIIKSGRGRPDLAEALMASSPAADGRIPVYCVICTNEIEGMHYQCTPCGVFLHPVCVQLPATVPSSGAHPEHELTLVCSFPTMCRACGAPCIWAYRCCLCLINLHANCIPESHYLLGCPYDTKDEPNGIPNRMRQFGKVIPPSMKPPPPLKALVNQDNPLVPVAPPGFVDPFAMPRRGPSTTPSICPDPWGGAFPFSGEYGRSTFTQ